MRKSTRHLFISPHLDDVALSCGGLVADLAQRGHEVIALTLFAWTPKDDELTPIARELKARWQAGEDPVATRRAEDGAACQVLGARPVHLGWGDCVYRAGPDGQGLYPSEASLFGDVHPQEQAFHVEITEAMASWLTPSCRVYGPLGAGHHVDHLLARDACKLLAAQGADVWLYEDYPYADDAAEVRRALAACGDDNGQAVVVPLSDYALDTKLEAVALHRSQIDTFWRDGSGLPDLGQMRRAITEYGRRIGGDTPAERYWPLASEESA